MNLQQNITTIDAWDDPASQIAFLEDTLHGKDWRVNIVYPDATVTTLNQLREAKSYYQQRGYLVREGFTETNQPQLELHALGKGTSLGDVTRELGAAKGIAHLIANPSIPLRSAMSSGASAIQWLDHSIHDPARANGVFNLTSEIFLFAAGFFTGNGTKREGTWRDSKNLLQSLSAAFFFAQSIVYAAFAKTNDEVAIDHLKHKFERVERAKTDITDLRFNPQQDMEVPNVWNTTMKFIRRYPVQLGSILNDLGMLAYIGHARANRDWNLKKLANPSLSPEDRTNALDYVGRGFNGFWKDVVGASISLAAWPLLLLPRKPRDEETIKKHEGNLLATSWDKFREDPQVMAGGLTLAASAFRLSGAFSKKNYTQAVGEGIYIGGDVALMFTANDAYGKETSKNIEKLAEKIAQYVNTQPYIFGAQTRETFVKNIADYLKQKSLEEVGGNYKKLKLKPEELEERSVRLTQSVIKKVAANDRFDQLRDLTIELVSLFPTHQRDSVTASLAATLSQLPWVKATEAEITQAIRAMPSIVSASDAPSTPTLSDIRLFLKQMVTLVETKDAAGSAVAIRRAIDPYMRDALKKTLSPRAPATSYVAALQMDAHLPSEVLR